MTPEQLMAALQLVMESQQSGRSLDFVLPQTSPLVPYGAYSNVTWTDWVERVKSGRINVNDIAISTKETPSMGAIPSARLYTCTGLFGLCGPDDIIGLTMADDTLISWIGFFPDTVCEKSIKGWVYFDQQGTAAGSLVGPTVYGPACETPPIAEKSTFEYYIGNFGTLRGCGAPVNVSEIGLRKCDKQPTYTIPVQGVGPIRINNDLDLETIAASQMVKHELSREIILGDQSVEGQFDGLASLVKEGWYDVRGHRITSVDSVVVDWESGGR